MSQKNNIPNKRVPTNSPPKSRAQTNNTPRVKKTNNAPRPAQANRRRAPEKTANKSVDFTLLLVVVLLVLFGIMMVYSASYYTDFLKYSDSTQHLRSQFLYAIVGSIGMYVASKVNYRIYFLHNIPWILYGGSLLLVLYAGFFGVSSNGASRWIRIFGFSLQPSELAKVAIIILNPYLITKNPKKLLTLKGHFELLLPTIIMAGAVAKENLSTAIIIAVIGTGVLFIASPRTKEFFILGFGAVLAMVLYLVASAFLGDGFRGGRLLAWLDPFAYERGKGYQIIQSLYAVASGGFFGLGLGNSRQKLTFIPEAHNDIIFAIICEELGFFGAFVLLMLFAIFIWRAFDISLRCKELFPALIAAGIAILISAQVLINVAVVTNTIPNTGIPLPFISSGGTALVVAMGLTGILLNISKSVSD